MDTTMIVLRLIHIGTGVFWAGAVFTAAMFLGPTARDLGPAAGPFMRHLMGVKKYSMRIIVSAILTILSGAGMFWVDMHRSQGTWAGSRQGIVFSLGAVTALLALIPGIGISARMGKRLVQLSGDIAASGAPPTPEQAAEVGRLQKMLGIGAAAAAALLSITVIAMSIARYV